ncbi:hypothetical protein AC482_03080 [miscellaneous Crenarchaeota group-15 archaeon DG-45]|uniref:Amidohydrolase-related domain-containing protein n=1 Tax=miscellaneous Crenarchaeota group-15 archaeon DG-45 TaxID=1685127 RepID=A0A0M0BQA0_9ARCH|nr:MAG: hypothetical protein AC482_03080 [miscellaneous Crenarchaeota group-15 archaeon DG-45]
MKADINIVGARVHLAGGLVDAGISIGDGRIVKIGKAPSLPEADEVVDARGLIALPGMIGAHVHLRASRLSYKEDFRSGTSAAAAGGFTTIVDMPNSDPKTDSWSNLMGRRREAGGESLVNVGFYALFSEDEEDLGRLASGPIMGFKIYLPDPWSGIDFDDDANLAWALGFAGARGRTVLFHAEDRPTIEENRRRLLEEGAESPEAWLSLHPPEAEIRAVERVLEVAGRMARRPPIHFCHVSTLEAVGMIQRARGSMDVTCEVTPHNMFLDESQVGRLGGAAIMAPPLRSRDTGEGLWRGLRSGLIDFVADDHAPHALGEKAAPSLWGISPGIPGLETTLSLLLDRANRGECSLGDVVRWLSTRPAGFLGLEGRGRLEEGCDGDVVLVDMGRRWVVDPTGFKSKARYTPFEGFELVGRPVKTFVGGVLVADEGEIVAEPGTGGLLG